MERLPVVVLSGFLGSGKTTLLNRWLRERQDLAVIINELGDIGIDQHLTRESRVPVTLLSGGCLCCVIQGSLSTTLRNLFMARKNGELPAFSTLVLETTGDLEGDLEQIFQCYAQVEPRHPEKLSAPLKAIRERR